MSETFWEDDDFILRFDIDRRNQWWVHNVVFNYNKNVFYKLKAVWLEALEELNNKNVSFVFLSFFKDNKKLKKYAEIFGFEELEIEHQYLKENNIIIMYVPTEM